ncbi:MAG: hypothetical protein FRX49_06007 [Trebouxia sp. A1-2]|nr:MAG: hypothetical protein FRX49_06007 [Trebouxia sp. A1-2]
MPPPGGTPTPAPKVALMLLSTVLLRCMPIIAMPVELRLAWLLYPPLAPIPPRLSVCMLRWLIQLPSTMRLLPAIACWMVACTRIGPKAASPYRAKRCRQASKQGGIRGVIAFTTRSSASAPLAEALIGGRVHVRCAQITTATSSGSSFHRQNLTDDIQGRVMGVRAQAYLSSKGLSEAVAQAANMRHMLQWQPQLQPPDEFAHARWRPDEDLTLVLGGNHGVQGQELIALGPEAGQAFQLLLQSDDLVPACRLMRQPIKPVWP